MHLPKYYCFLFTIAICLLLNLNGICQSILIHPEELTFFSKFEEEAYKQVINQNKSAYFASFLAIDSTVGEDYHNTKYTVFKYKIDEIKTAKFEKKSHQKKIKQIYNSLHHSFLRKYELKNSFSTLFKSGLYNCVSATALYAIALEELGIDYTIRETPTHVYLIAYPQTLQILIETTDPAGGYYAFNEKFKSDFINKMKKRKLISDQEYSNKSIHELFNEHYFTDENIQLKELLGIQYYNDALYNLEEERYEYACHQLEKAFLLYPSESIGYLLAGTTALALGQKELDDPQFIEYLIKLTRFHNYEIDPNDIIGEFARFTVDQLTNKYNVKHYDSMFVKLHQNIADTNIVQSISRIYYNEKGRVLYNKGQYLQALPLIEKAYHLQPDNADNQMMLVSALAQRVNTLSSNLAKIEFLQEYTNKYQTITENSMLRGYLLQLYLIQFSQGYDLNNEKEANQYRQLFENEMSRISDNVPLNTELIGRAYSLAAVYYFKRGHDHKARILINKGLEYAPDNFELLQRKKILAH